MIQTLRLSLLRVQNYQNNVWIIRFEINSENGPVDMLKCVSYINICKNYIYIPIVWKKIYWLFIKLW